MATSAEIGVRLKEMGLEVHSVFVPFSSSRNKKEKNPSLNWIIKLVKVKSRIGDVPMDTAEVLTTDYNAGMGHCPSCKQGSMSVDQMEAVRWECENGMRCSPNMNLGPHAHLSNKKLLPDAANVVHSLLLDGEAIDYKSFEEWADCFGYDKDSRAAEKTYQACLSIGLQLRAVLGDEMLKQLRVLFQDY